MIIALLTGGCRVRPEVEATLTQMRQYEKTLEANPEDDATMQRLIAFTQESDPGIRENALAFLGRLSQRDERLAKASVPFLAAALKDKEQGIRRTAASGLALAGPSASPARDALIGALSEGNVDVAWFAAEALGNLKAEGRPAVPALIEALTKRRDPDKDPEVELRVASAQALGSLGPVAVEAIPALEEAAAGDNGSVSMAATDAIAKISLVQ